MRPLSGKQRWALPRTGAQLRESSARRPPYTSRNIVVLLVVLGLVYLFFSGPSVQPAPPSSPPARVVDEAPHVHMPGGEPEDASLIVDTTARQDEQQPGAATAAAGAGAAAAAAGSGAAAGTLAPALAVDAHATKPVFEDGMIDAPHDPMDPDPTAVHGAAAAPGSSGQHATGLYALSAIDIHGKLRSLSEFAGKVSLVVNVASQCGFTDANYRGLQSLYAKFRDAGFEVLAWPCNSFGGQEQGSDAEVLDFATSRYGATFTLFSKVEVNGPNTHPVFAFLKRELPAAAGGGAELAWNFQKFLVDRAGKPVRLFTQAWDQAAIEGAVHELLVKGST